MPEKNINSFILGKISKKKKKQKTILIKKFGKWDLT